MRIAIDAQTTLGKKTGFGFYVKNLAENLKKIDKINKYFIILPKSSRDLSTPKRFYWDQIGFPLAALKNKPDIIHQTCFSAPIMHGKAKVVLTCHDIIGVTYGADMSFFSRQYFGRWMPFCYKFANKIICNSEYTKNDLIKVLKINPKKLVVVYLAADPIFKPVNNQELIDKTKSKYQIKNKYLLYLGTLNPRKNIELLINVFAQIHKNLPEYQLVIAGKKTWHYENLLRLAQSSGIADKTLFTDYVSDEDSLHLYNGAELFLFPSLYEGFGFPPLEAMSCGKPVISSNATSLPEIVGEGGILIKPDDVKSWAAEISRLINNNNLRKELSTKALMQARKFSWKKCAVETKQVYEEIYENSH